MLFEKGDVVYKMPIRYWEDKEPVKCIVVKEIAAEHVRVDMKGSSILVYSEEHKHEVYVDRRDLFFTKENAMKAIGLYTQLHDLYADDEALEITNRILSERENK